MARFLFVYRGNPDAYARMSPEDMQNYNQKWGAWIRDAMQHGWMVDPGDALRDEGRVVSPNVVTDGPFVESKEIVGGYSIVEAETLDAAAKLARDCPGLLVGRVEVRALAGYTMKS